MTTSPRRASVPNGNNHPARTPRSGTPVATNLPAPGLKYKIWEKTGYTDTRFAGKEKQLLTVIKVLQSKGFIPNDLVENEVLDPVIAIRF